MLPVHALSTYDPLVLHTSLLDNGGLLQLVRASSLLLRNDVAGVEEVDESNDSSDRNHVHRNELQIKPVLGRLDNLDGAAVSVDAVLLTGLLIVDQKAELDRELLGLEFGDKVEGNLHGTATDGSERARLESGGGHVAEHAASLSVGLFGVEEGTGDGLECEQTVLLGSVGDREDDSVGLTILDNCGVKSNLRKSQ